MSEYDDKIAAMCIRTPEGHLGGTPLSHLISIGTGLIEGSAGENPEYARGIIELLTEFAGFPLGDNEPRAAMARALGIGRKEEMTLKQAFEIVLNLARQNVIDGDDENRQWEALQVVEDNFAANL